MDGNNQSYFLCGKCGYPLGENPQCAECRGSMEEWLEAIPMGQREQIEKEVYQLEMKLEALAAVGVDAERRKVHQMVQRLRDFRKRLRGKERYYD